VISGKRIFKNTGGITDQEIEDYRSTLIRLRGEFLSHATINTQIIALQIRDGVGVVSAEVREISTQLKWVSTQVSNIGM
jgi:hypothetical protein